jgi:hypothetical protein
LETVWVPQGQEESPVHTLCLTNNTGQPLEFYAVRFGARWRKKRRRTSDGAVFHDGGVVVAAYSAASNPGRTGCVCNGVTVAVSAGATCAPVIFSGLLPVRARTTT